MNNTMARGRDDRYLFCRCSLRCEKVHIHRLLCTTRTQRSLVDYTASVFVNNMKLSEAIGCSLPPNHRRCRRWTTIEIQIQRAIG